MSGMDRMGLGMRRVTLYLVLILLVWCLDNHLSVGLSRNNDSILSQYNLPQHQRLEFNRQTLSMKDDGRNASNGEKVIKPNPSMQHIDVTSYGMNSSHITSNLTRTNNPPTKELEAGAVNVRKSGRVTDIETQEALVLEYAVNSAHSALHLSINSIPDIIRTLSGTVAGIASLSVRSVGGLFKVVSDILSDISSRMNYRLRRSVPGKALSFLVGGVFKSLSLSFHALAQICIFAGDTIELITVGMGQAMADSFIGLSKVVSLMHKMTLFFLRPDQNTSDKQQRNTQYQQLNAPQEEEEVIIPENINRSGSPIKSNRMKDVDVTTSLLSKANRTFPQSSFIYQFNPQSLVTWTKPISNVANLQNAKKCDKPSVWDRLGLRYFFKKSNNPCETGKKSNSSDMSIEFHNSTNSNISEFSDVPLPQNIHYRGEAKGIPVNEAVEDRIVDRSEHDDLLQEKPNANNHSVGESLNISNTIDDEISQWIINNTPDNTGYKRKPFPGITLTVYESIVNVFRLNYVSSSKSLILRAMDNPPATNSLYLLRSSHDIESVPTLRPHIFACLFLIFLVSFVYSSSSSSNHPSPSIELEHEDGITKVESCQTDIEDLSIDEIYISTDTESKEEDIFIKYNTSRRSSIISPTRQRSKSNPVEYLHHTAKLIICLSSVLAVWIYLGFMEQVFRERLIAESYANTAYRLHHSSVMSDMRSFQSTVYDATANDDLESAQWFNILMKSMWNLPFVRDSSGKVGGLGPYLGSTIEGLLHRQLAMVPSGIQNSSPEPLESGFGSY